MTKSGCTKLNVSSNASNGNYYVPFIGQSGSDGTFYYNASNYIKFNPSTGRVGIGGTSTSYKLYVNGSIVAAGGDITAFATSDIRFKNNIVPIKNPLEKLKKINGYTFVWKESVGNFLNRASNFSSYMMMLLIVHTKLSST